MMVENRLKALYIGGFHLPDKNAAAHRVLANGKILNKLGYDLVFLGIDKNEESRNNVLATHKSEYYGDDYKLKYPHNNLEWLKYITNIKDVISIIEMHDVKIVFAYNHPAIALYRLFKYCRNNGIKLIADSTEWYVPNGNIIFKIVKGFDTFLRMRVIQPRLDGIIVISKFLFDFYSRKNNNVVLIPPLVDKSDTKWSNAETNEDNSDYRFIYAGTPGGKQKDQIGKIVSAFVIINQKYNEYFHFDVLGITLEEYNKLWSEYPIPYNLKDNFNFYGRLSNINAIKKLQSADFSIFIRDNNLVTKAGFPTKMVESMSAGIPVLTNKSSNIEDYLKEEINGCFLDNTSINSLVESLYKVFCLNKSKVDEMKLNCKNESSFDYTKYVTEFDKLIEK